MIGGSAFKDIGDYEVDDGKRKSGDNEADDGVEDGLFGFLEFIGVTGGSHVIDATDEDENDGDESTDGDDGI